MKSKVKITKCLCASIDTKEYCYFAKANDFIQLTEWVNKEGFDVLIETETKNPIILQLTIGQIRCIIDCYKKIMSTS